MIYVIGTGAGVGNISEGALETIKNSPAVIVKTGKSLFYGAVLKSGIGHTTLDFVYEKSRNFDTLNANLAKEVLKTAKEKGGAAYIVDGSGYEDKSVEILFSKTKHIKVIPNTGKASALAAIPSTSYTVFSAYDFAGLSYPEFSTAFPIVIYEADSAYICGEIKLRLFRFYSEDTEILIEDNEGCKRIPLFDMDRQKSYSYATAFVIPPQALLEKKRFTFSDLLSIMQRLRAKGGCPWDREQTHESIKMNSVEEAYELAEAIDNKDPGAMAEEAGDLLLQTVFQSRIAEDMSEFDIYEVLSTLCQKLIFRHSHIFGSDKAKSSGEALKTWEKNKNIEKGQDTFTKTLKDVAKTFPSLMRAEKVQKRAAKCGFDFPDAKQALDKLNEEIGELTEAFEKGDKDEVLKEAGDLLFSAVNYIRKLGAESELALTASTDKFIKRFEYMENKILSSGKDMSETTLEEMDKYYTESKKDVN